MLFAMLTISGMLVLVICVFATGLYRFGGHRLQKRNLYSVILATFLNIVLLGLLKPSLNSVMMALVCSTIIAFGMGYWQMKWFTKRLDNENIMLPRNARTKGLMIGFVTIVACQIVFRTSFGKMLFEMSWPLLSVGFGWLFSSYYFLFYVAAVERKSGKPIIERLKDT